MNDWIDGYDTNGVLVFLTFALVLPVAVTVARLYRFPSTQFLARWFEHHELEQTPDSVALVTHSLRRTKQIRSAGFVLVYSGLQLGWMLYTRSAYRSDELPFISLLLGGWTITVVVAALWGVPRPSGAASLAERRVDDYRPAFSHLDRQVLLVALVAVTVASFAFPAEKSGTTIDGALALQRSLPAVAAMVIVWLAQRVIVGRRQSFSSLDLVRADDALRAVGVSALTGIGYGIPLLAIGTTFWQLMVVREPAGLAMLGVILASSALNMFGLMSILGFGRLGNEMVVYRHRLRRGADPQPTDDRAEGALP